MANYVSRVIKLDAVTLDEEIFKIVEREIRNLLDSFKVSNWISLEDYKPELKLLIKSIFWTFFIAQHKCSLGQRLLSVRYLVKSKKSLALLFILESFVPYLYQRLPTLTNFSGVRCNLETRRKVEKCLDYAKSIFDALKIINFFLFLYENRYPTIESRLANVQVVPIQRHVHPSVGYTYQLRELLWHQFGEFLMILLPVINVYKLKRYVSSIKGRWRSKSSKVDNSISNESDSPQVAVCCYCSMDCVLPHKRRVCTYCYYCQSLIELTDPEGFKACPKHC